MSTLALLPSMAESLAEVRALHGDLNSCARTTIAKAIRIGELLNEIKGSLKHGQWLPWIKENLPFDERTSQNYMRVWDSRTKYETISDLSITDAYKLLSSGGKDTAHVSHNSGDNEWYTPVEFITAANQVMGSIDCDPASSAIANKTVKAKKFFTREQDGLTKAWTGNVWMNPPYSQPLIGQFADAISTKFISGEITQAIALVNNATETAWFCTMAETAASICFPCSRIRFIDPKGEPSGAPLQGQALIYFGTKAKKFAKQFERFGFVLCKP